MDAQKTVGNFIKKHIKWETELNQLRAIFKDTELREEIKWGAPAYTLNGKIVAGFMGFKNHLGLWFHQGVFLKDPHKKLINAQEGKTKALRQWRFEKGDVIEPNMVLEYIEESIANCKAGKEIKPQRNSKEIVLPKLLQETFDKDPHLRDAFQQLTKGKQREYTTHIIEAKREATQLNRLQKIIPLIKEGKGLYDRYKNC